MATGRKDFQEICGQGFGHLSAAHKSTWGRNLISSGKGDPGGVSTGFWSISELTMKDFRLWCKKHDCRYGSNLTTANPGTRVFRKQAELF